MTHIGPTFVDELAAAGLVGLPFTWGSDGKIQYGDAITPEQRAAIETVVAAHPSQEEIKAQLKAYAADHRWRKETGGVTLPNGVIVRTDDAAQRKVAELRRRAAAGEIPLPFSFKAETGWIDADLSAIQAIDQAIAAHVAACYTLERQIDNEIDAGEVTTRSQIELAFGETPLDA